MPHLPHRAAVEDGQLSAQLLHPAPVAAYMGGTQEQRAAAVSDLSSLHGQQDCFKRQCMCSSKCAHTHKQARKPSGTPGAVRQPGRKVWAPSISLGSSWSQCRSDSEPNRQLLANCAGVGQQATTEWMVNHSGGSASGGKLLRAALDAPWESSRLQ